MKNTDIHTSEKGKRFSLSPLQKKARRRRRFLRTIIVVVGVLVCIRIALPVVALKLINDKLAGMPDYSCTIRDIDLSILTASATVKGIRMEKKNGKVREPFFQCNKIHIQVESLKKRASNLEIGHCIIHLVKGKDKASSQMSLDKEWLKLLEEMPLKPNTLVIQSGEVHYSEHYRKPRIHLSMTDIHVEGENLENLKGITDTMPSKLTLTAKLQGADLKAAVKLDRTGKNPEAIVVASLSPLQLKTINPVLKTYTGFNVQQGTFSVFTNIKLKNNRLNGYAKPVVKNLQLVTEDEKKPFLKRVAAKVVQAGVNLLERDETKKIVARVEISGKADNPDLSIWQVLGSAIAHAFGKSIQTGIEHPLSEHKVSE